MLTYHSCNFAFHQLPKYSITRLFLYTSGNLSSKQCVSLLLCPNCSVFMCSAYFAWTQWGAVSSLTVRLLISFWWVLLALFDLLLLLSTSSIWSLGLAVYVFRFQDKAAVNGPGSYKHVPPPKPNYDESDFYKWQQVMCKMILLISSHLISRYIPSVPS